jgi:hypothetical protein
MKALVNGSDNVPVFHMYRMEVNNDATYTQRKTMKRSPIVDQLAQRVLYEAMQEGPAWGDPMREGPSLFDPKQLHPEVPGLLDPDYEQPWGPGPKPGGPFHPDYVEPHGPPIPPIQYRKIIHPLAYPGWVLIPGRGWVCENPPCEEEERPYVPGQGEGEFDRQHKKFFDRHWKRQLRKILDLIRDYPWA